MSRNKMNRYIISLILASMVFIVPFISLAEEKKDTENEFAVPSHVLTISKQNTFPNTSEDQEIIEPSELAKQLMDGLNINIENPSLIKLLNETSLKPSPISFGYRGLIYLGRWPLNYTSENTTVNWEYQQINLNEMNNLGGANQLMMNYHQQEQKDIRGALTNKISNSSDVKNMILTKAKDKTNLPLSYHTVIGQGTKTDQSYHVPAKKYGYLYAYAPAVNEVGQITFGEVFLELKGNKTALVIKNVTKQGIGAWLPIQDHVSFSFQIKE